MGYDLMINFRRPYLAQSIREFWHRWHISLSTWFRDYVYIPLGGSEGSTRRLASVVLITFGLSGLWHGANWTFIAWGALNGIYLLVGKASAELRARLRHAVRLPAIPSLEVALRVLVTFSLVCVGWVLFRAPTLHDAFMVFGRMLDWRQSSLQLLPMLASSFGIALVLIAVLVVVEIAEPAADPRRLLLGQPAWVRWSSYYAVLLGIAVHGVFNQSQFIYFQF